MPDTALKVAPTTGEKIAAGGILALNTAVVTGAPLLNNINPAINPTNAGGIAVTLIGNGVLVLVQALAAQDWFDDIKLGVWACIVFSVVICSGLYIVLLGNPELGVLNSLGTMYQASSGYGPLNKLGVFSRSSDSDVVPIQARS